jgi:hypothetical protein
MNAIADQGLLNPLLPVAPAAPQRHSSAFGLRSDVTIIVPFWFVLVVCFAAVMMVFLSLGFLYAVLLAEPAIVTISDILSHTDTVVKSMVASSAGAISSGNALVRSAIIFLHYNTLVADEGVAFFHLVIRHVLQAFEPRVRSHSYPANAVGLIS